MLAAFMKAIVQALSLVLLALPLQAGETLNLNLQKAIQLALAKNFRIKVEEFAPKIAKARQLSASGAFDPVFETSYTYDHNEQLLNTLNTEIDTPTVVPGDPTPDLFARTNGHEFDSSVAGLTPWGLTYDVGASLNTDDDSRRDPGFTRYDSFFGISVIQPLLKNFGTDVNLSQIRIARADRAISHWQFRQEVIDVVTETITIYSDLYFSEGNLEVSKRSRDLASQLLADNLKRAEIGVMAPLDVLQARSDLAAREEEVIVAERAVADNQNFLKQLITDEISRLLKLHLNIMTPVLPDMTPPDIEKDLARAMELRPDFRQALLDIQKRQINVVFTRNQALPRLDLVASFGVNGIDSDLANSLIRTYGDGQNNLAWNAGAVVSIPIPNRDARGQLQVSKLEVARALIDLKRLEQTIIVQADNAAGQIDTTRKRIEATRVAREFAKETLDAAQARLASGTSTTFEVLQFQRDLATAEVSALRARTDHIKAIAEYARQIGSTLSRNGIVMEGQ